MTVAGKVRQALVHCSSSVLPGYKLGKTETYPGQTADYEKSFATWKSLPCEVFLACHGQFFDLHGQAQGASTPARPTPSSTPPAARPSTTKSEAAFRAELKKQKRRSSRHLSRQGYEVLSNGLNPA